MNLSLIVTICVIVFLVIFMIMGFYRGFLRIILTTFSMVLTLVLAGTFAGPLANYVENNTVIGPRVQSRIDEYVTTQLAAIPGAAATAETSFIDALPLPNAMKEDLKAKNTLAGYVDQGVSSFSEYIAVNLTSLVIRILSYVILFLVIYLVIRLILKLSNLINHIPLLGGINRFFGGIIGLAEGVLFLWLLCMVIMMLSGTELGVSCEKVINDSTVLTFLYEHNYLMDIVNGVLGIFRK